MATGMFDLAGKAAFVPGGYGGIGSAIARVLAEAGAGVAVAGRDVRKAEALAKELQEAGHRATGLAVDARDVASIAAATDEAARQLGGLDILVNCIGFNREQTIADVTEEQFSTTSCS
jgi:gluconate 5-dehydrogenase